MNRVISESEDFQATQTQSIHQARGNNHYLSNLQYSLKRCLSTMPFFVFINRL